MERKLSPYISQKGAWALALGTSIGWGSLVVTSNTYLVQAGPWGSILGLLIGMAVMLVISKNYHYMINCYPDAGGAYAYCKEVFGYDQGFLTAWFLCLTYAAMFWANATSLPLFARYFLGETFHIGRMYRLFGYDVYFGETLLTIAVIVLVTLLCTRFRKAVMAVLIALAVVLAAAIVICFTAAVAGHGGTAFSFSPGFIEDKRAVSQVIRIACISPWAFIGFENISHAAEEFRFPRSRIFRILSLAVVSATVLYVCVLLLSVTAYPPEYAGWLDYIRDLGNLSGIKGLPAFYAAQHYLGSAGVHLLIIALFGLIVTSLIGNVVALSRLLYVMAKDSILPGRFAEINRHGVPQNAILLIMVLSLPIPFLGRTAIGWIVDVTTIGATIIYGFVSAAAHRLACRRGDRTEQGTGLAGLLLMIGFAAYLLLPNLFTTGTLEKESYFLFVIWAVLGFLFFRNILSRDKAGRFGKSIIVWIALLSLVLFIALIWMNQSMMASADQAMDSIHEYYTEAGAEEKDPADEEFIRAQIGRLERSNTTTMMVVAGLFAFSLAIMLTNYTYMNKKARENEAALGHAKNLANTDPLTGVKSKHAYVEREQEMDAQISAGEMEPFAVVVCDVNGLKQVNDTLGHKAGDEYIRSAAHLICELFQHSPVYRVGGDEFTVLLTGRDYETRQELLEALRRRSEENIPVKQVIVAGGLAEWTPETDREVHPVFERADGEMYREKQRLKALGAVSR